MRKNFKCFTRTDFEIFYHRIWPRVVINKDLCWLWQGASQHGYGSVRINNKPTSLHRFTYSLFKKRLENGKELDHLCRNKSCCNPSHLEQVTHKENVFRGNAPCVALAARTHCKHGHQFSGSNMIIQYYKGRPFRRCMACARAIWKSRVKSK